LAACHLLLYQLHDVVLHLLFLRWCVLTRARLLRSVGCLHHPGLFGLLELLSHLRRLLHLWRLLRLLLLMLLLLLVPLLLLLLLHPVLL